MSVPQSTSSNAPKNVEIEQHDEDENHGPALRLAGIEFFIVDVNRKRMLWHETGSQAFESQVHDLQEASSTDALRTLTPEDRRSVLRLIQGAIKDGKAGPYDVGGSPDHRVPGIPLMAYRHELPGGGMIVICFSSTGDDEQQRGNAVLGLAPILQHFVSSSDRIVFLVDNFGYIRFASEGFIKQFGIQDSKLVMGRNIAHVQNRVGRSLTTLCLTALTRRDSANGHAKFLLANGDSLELNYNAMYFRIGGAIGGVLFSASKNSGNVDFAKVFDLCGSPMLVVDVKSRMVLAANAAAYKAYHLTQEVLDEKPITETLLHASSYSVLLEAAQSGSDVPTSVVVNSLNGMSKKKRIRASLIKELKTVKLLLEART